MVPRVVAWCVIGCPHHSQRTPPYSNSLCSVGSRVPGKDSALPLRQCRGHSHRKIRTSRIPLAMHLMRSLFFFTARFNMSLVAEHIPGRHNEAADAVSRNNLALFYQQVPGAEQLPTPIPQELWETLVTHQPDWTSVNWRAQFSTIL